MHTSNFFSVKNFIQAKYVYTEQHTTSSQWIYIFKAFTDGNILLQHLIRLAYNIKKKLTVI